MTHHFNDLDAAVDHLLAQLPTAMHVAAPLGLGKPHRLLNALYARVEGDPARPLHLYTALSLDPPSPGQGLKARFVRPFLARHFGDDFPRLAYVQAMKRDALPAHVEVEEFYLQSGALLDSSQTQRRYASLNYTHVAAALAHRRTDMIVQKVARAPGGDRLSFSCNTDLTQDTVDAHLARGLPRPLMVAEVDPHLPWLGGSAVAPAGFFDVVIDPPAPHPRPFGLPRQPVDDADYAIGLYASTLVRDGGTLQIGIGALADALCHALVLRHTDNARYRQVLAALDPDLEDHPAVRESGGLGPFEIGLYGCSEMINEGFKRLVETGVIRRKVVDDPALMQRLADGTANLGDHARLERDGEYLHGAFYLGSPDFYAWLRDLPDEQRHAIGMRRIGTVNQIHGNDEALQRLQRHDARFFNSCMMATALGAAVSDALEDGRVVSGVGGQYNFVAMAHALPGARSVLLLRAVREAHGRTDSNVRWNYGHATIPRHLRDVYVDEYGIADLRYASDEDCVIAMAGITDARYRDGLLEHARAARKLRAGFQVPARWERNTPQRLGAALAPFRTDGTLPDYPLGSDFTAVEQRLVRALAWLQAGTARPAGKLQVIVRALRGSGQDDAEALARMGLDAPRGAGAWLEARLLRLALAQTARPA
ncbi:acetyl-CoA hydrolase [Pseudoxanthomonas daejeonensis]|uniref:acetyl-CoA hydrolase/transferase C-terminal domain-containing protein n=1 Tax=Pseudoxanthomonas daejeonensis TaxID=266062 RepID=UPI001F540FC7|nr:acetyl-CoA hydrolase/transferase C-terminal domain-containing protein [Pseudoxanthomonas daejeonensis]UNK58084.1 acetyl-CoA hydrolase [Pseudoxanthomonas daejeonensis]